MGGTGELPIETAPGVRSEPASVPEPAAARERCANCGGRLTGEYCSTCGQRREHGPASLGHFLGTAFEDVTHADSRLWRTLAALLFRPGLLTEEFFAGRRARYLPPVRLYLIASVLFFLLASPGRPHLLVMSSDRPAPSVTELTSPNSRTASAVAGRESAQAPPDARAGARASNSTHPVPDEDANAVEDDAAERRALDCGSIPYSGPWRSTVGGAIRAACQRTVLDKGQWLKESVLHNLPRAIFLLLPLLALVMKLMYWRPRRYYVEHLLFFVHNHAAVFAILVLVAALSATVPPLRAHSLLGLAATGYIAWYLYASMRRVYGQGRWWTLSKLSALGVAYAVCALVMFVLTLLYSVLTVSA